MRQSNRFAAVISKAYVPKNRGRLVWKEIEDKSYFEEIALEDPFVLFPQEYPSSYEA